MPPARALDARRLVIAANGPQVRTLLILKNNGTEAPDEAVQDILGDAPPDVTKGSAAEWNKSPRSLCSGLCGVPSICRSGSVLR